MIKLIVFDFDGVFTDGKFYFDNNDNIKKCYNGKDAYSLKIIKKYDIKCGIITNDKVISIKHAPHIFDRLDKVSLGSDKPKLEILDTWLDEYSLTYQEVAYIGDDLPDIPVLEKVGFSGCPHDAVEEVKKVSHYNCKNRGGDGAVREFVDLIIKKNIAESEKNDDKKVNNDGKITAVIPVRKGSTRCNNKNIRKFGDTNLLKLKIETLKRVKGIDKILVSSNCDIMLGVAKDMGVDIHKRDEQYCTNHNPGEFFCNLASSIDTNILMHVPVTTPFISICQYNEILAKWNEINVNHDSLNASTKIKEFIWHNNKAVNYDRNNPPPSQDLPDFTYLNFGCNIINKKSVLRLNNIVGRNPFLFEIDKISGLDIDENTDFIMAELLYKNNILNEDICKNILQKRNDKIVLLDCTIRDGGYLNNWNFPNEKVLDCYKAVTEAGYDYFEIGFKTNKKLLENKGKWCYSTEEDINNIYKKYNGCKIAVMAKIGTVTIDDFVRKDESNITMVRVLLARATQENGTQKSYYNKLDVIKAKTFCEKLIDYGYEVCMNFGCGDIIDEDEIKIIASEFNNVNINALYLADTYGGFNTSNIATQLHKFYSEFNKYDSNIPFGFHCHNNNEDAFDKTTTAIYNGCTMIDSCIGGLGRGAGNLKSEQLMSYLYKNNYEYIKNITPLVVYFDKHILSKKEYQENQHINSHPYYMISSVLSLHPNYITEILSLNTNVEQDIELIMKLDKYTKENNERNYNKNLVKKNVCYDIVYSIIFHQDVDFVNHFLKNIEKYNIKNNYLIIVHLSDNLYNQKEELYKKNVIINPIHYDKKLFTHLLIKAFIENFEFLISQKICFNNYMTLTSSNRLVRQAPKFEFQNIKLYENKTIQNIENLERWWWPAFLKNKEIVEIFQNNKIKLIKGEIAGRLYSKNLIEKVCDFIRKEKILEIIEEETVFEEVILPSLANYYLNKKQELYCHTFRNIPSIFPTVDNVKQILEEKPNIYIIKRFPNDLNHILFKTTFS